MYYLLLFYVLPYVRVGEGSFMYVTWCKCIKPINICLKKKNKNKGYRIKRSNNVGRRWWSDDLIHREPRQRAGNRPKHSLYDVLAKNNMHHNNWEYHTLYISVQTLAADSALISSLLSGLSINHLFSFNEINKGTSLQERNHSSALFSYFLQNTPACDLPPTGPTLTLDVDIDVKSSGKWKWALDRLILIIISTS